MGPVVSSDGWHLLLEVQPPSPRVVGMRPDEGNRGTVQTYKEDANDEQDEPHQDHKPPVLLQPCHITSNKATRSSQVPVNTNTSSSHGLLLFLEADRVAHKTLSRFGHTTQQLFSLSLHSLSLSLHSLSLSLSLPSHTHSLSLSLLSLSLSLSLHTHTLSLSLLSSLSLSLSLTYSTRTPFTHYGGVAYLLASHAPLCCVPRDQPRP